MFQGNITETGPTLFFFLLHQLSAKKEDLVVSLDGEAELYDMHRSSRKEVLRRKVEACSQSLI